jgi:ParB-like chromosome segregation protein Spo0J
VRLITTRQVPLHDLHLLDGNPRRGDVDAVAASLDRHGQFRALVVRADTMTVLAGNHTLQAMAQLSWERALCHLIECDDREARQIALADNRIPELGSYDPEALTDMLRDLDGDYAATGYEQGDLDGLIARLSLPEAGDAEIDDDGSGVCAVVIDCSTESEQRQLIDRLSAEGLICRALN